MSYYYAYNTVQYFRRGAVENCFHKKLCLIKYNTQYRMIGNMLMTRFVSNATVEMDRPIISIKLNLLLCKLNLYA